MGTRIGFCGVRRAAVHHPLLANSLQPGRQRWLQHCMPRLQEGTDSPVVITVQAKVRWVLGRWRDGWFGSRCVSPKRAR